MIGRMFVSAVYAAVVIVGWANGGWVGAVIAFFAWQVLATYVLTPLSVALLRRCGKDPAAEIQREIDKADRRADFLAGK